MFDTLPRDVRPTMSWPWSQYEPFFKDLTERELNAGSVDAWLKDWTRVAELLYERYSRSYVATTVDTTDTAAEEAFRDFMANIYPHLMQAGNTLNKRLLDSGLQPEGFEIPLRDMRTEVELFREENLPLVKEENDLSMEYDKIIGAQTVEWEGQELTLTQLSKVQQEADRARREQAWRLDSQRRLQDREALNELWGKLLDLRLQMARNAGFDSYLDYRWKQMNRFDYTPEDAESFHRAIEEAVVPAAVSIYERRRRRLGYDTLRPWDLDVDARGLPPLKPFSEIDELNRGCVQIFEKVDPALGRHFRTMLEEELLDLDNRKGKAPGGYCISFDAVRRPFIFMNAVGKHDDVQTMLHEGGHAFHVFESAGLPYAQQTNVPIEFAEVASMAMELLAAPYLAQEQGGFYTGQEAARARIEHLEKIVLFWPYMAVVDAFQLWVYRNPEDARNPANCDAKWTELWGRFMKGVDYSGLEEHVATGWHRKLHIFHIPFYYIEYGLAQLGAVQVWANALEDQAAAVASYRRALALGGTVSLPELFATAGARFAMDIGTLGGAVQLVEMTIEQLERV